jgi:cytochrome c oxidase subunit 2
VSRAWSLLFLLVPILGVGLFLAAANPDSRPLLNHWFPEDVSSHGHVIDSLFYSILMLTGMIFVATGLALFWFLWKYDAAKNREPVRFMHGSHTLEIVWSILPAATLVFIAVYQMNAWADAKLFRPMLAGVDGQLGTDDDVPQPPFAEVKGRQFEWRIRYAGDDGVIGTPDDIFTVNDLRLPVDEEVVLQIKSEDVLHSFFLPNFRVKQDVVPGMKQFVWFKPMKQGSYDIVCAELCGWGHYKMKGRVTVHSRQDLDRWLAAAKANQEMTQAPVSAGDNDE